MARRPFRSPHKPAGLAAGSQKPTGACTQGTCRGLPSWPGGRSRSPRKTCWSSQPGSRSQPRRHAENMPMTVIVARRPFAISSQNWLVFAAGSQKPTARPPPISRGGGAGPRGAAALEPKWLRHDTDTHKPNLAPQGGPLTAGSLLPAAAGSPKPGPSRRPAHCWLTAASRGRQPEFGRARTGGGRGNHSSQPTGALDPPATLLHSIQHILPVVLQLLRSMLKRIAISLRSLQYDPLSPNSLPEAC
jgi:hypothetical protein